MKEHIQSSPPRHLSQLEQIKAALKAATDRYAWLKGTRPSNDLALKAQHNIISQYERQISELEDTWLTI